MKTRPKVPRRGVEAALNASRRVAERLAHLARDPEVRREAQATAEALGRLLGAVRRAGSGRAGQGSAG